MCLGRTDLPLDTLGRLQAALLGVSLRPAALYSSPLVRARETARPMGEAKILPGLTERFAGDWDGLCFDEIRSRWPELYAARGEDPSLPMPGAEPDSAALARFSAALEAILRETPRGAAAVSHAGVIGLYLESLGLPGVKIPYGSYVRLGAPDGGALEAAELGVLPRPKLTDGVCLALLRAAGTPERAVRHCAAAADRAGRLARAAHMDPGPIRAAALLHDIARGRPRHPELGADWLAGLGYPETAELIRAHHDHPGDRLDAAGIVCLADKLVLGERPCTLEERFAASAEKCRAPEQKKAHERRFAAARRLAKYFEEKGVSI